MEDVQADIISDQSLQYSQESENAHFGVEEFTERKDDKDLNEIDASLETATEGIDYEHSSTQSQNEEHTVSDSDICDDIENKNISAESTDLVKGDDIQQTEHKKVEEIRATVSVTLPSRQQLLEQYNKVLQERKELKKQNMKLQSRIAQHLKSRKIDVMLPGPEASSAEMQQQYFANLDKLNDIRFKYIEEEEFTKQHSEKLKKTLEEKESGIKEETVRFEYIKQYTASKSVNSSTGKTMSPEEIEHYLNKERQKDKILREIRLESIEQQNKLFKTSEQLKGMDELPEGLYFIEFEQLGMENQTFYVKIQERHEDMLKLQQKYADTTHILSHVKEKLCCMESEKNKTLKILKGYEDEVKSRRDQLVILKVKQEETRSESHELKQKFKLLKNEKLLQDHEKTKIKCENLKQNLNHLKKKYYNIFLPPEDTSKQDELIESKEVNPEQFLPVPEIIKQKQQ